MKKVTLHPAEKNNYKRFYDMADAVYEIRNEDGTQIGLLFLTYYVDGSLFIEWMELMSCFQYNGYLRHIFTELHRMFPDKVIQLQCSEEKEYKFTGIGCCIRNFLKKLLKVWINFHTFFICETVSSFSSGKGFFYIFVLAPSVASPTASTGSSALLPHLIIFIIDGLVK